MNKVLLGAVCVFLAGLIVAGCRTTPTAEDESAFTPLSGSEVRETLGGNSLYREGGDLLRSWEYVGLLREDGTLSARVWWSGGEEFADGVWEVTEDDLYCRTWNNNWGDGERGCFRVSKAEQTLAFDHVSGSRGDADRYTYRFLPGNPYGL